MRQTMLTSVTAAMAIAMTASAQAPPRDPDISAQYGNTFDIVWQTVASGFDDSTFGGRDWEAIGHEFRGRAVEAPSDSAFYVTLNAMLFQLGVSHIGVIPDDHPEWIGAPAVFADGDIGVDVRIVEGAIVVTRVRPDSPGAVAGLQPGAVIRDFNGSDVEQLRRRALAEPRPALDARLLVNEQVQGQFYGPAGTDMTVSWRTSDGGVRTASIRREARLGRAEFMDGIPPMFLECEVRWERADIGYIRFNAFHPALLPRILEALDEFQQAAGVIIDVRGNVGGAIGVRRTLVERLVGEAVTFWIYRYRDRTEELVVEPASTTYGGKLVILTDAMSASSAEEFAGGLQAIGRAEVVGVRTPGNVLVADVVSLPLRATLVFPVAQTQVADGTVLEGRGVIPDHPIPLTPETLAHGRDLQLETAVAVLEGRAPPAPESMR
jgi:carboxyl-terminal processing protease